MCCSRLRSTVCYCHPYIFNADEGCISYLEKCMCIQGGRECCNSMLSFLMPPRAFWKWEAIKLHGDLANHVFQNKAFPSDIVLSQFTNADYFVSAHCPNRANWHVFAIEEGQSLKWKLRICPKYFSGSEKGWMVYLLLVLQDFALEQNIFFIPWLFLSDTFYHRLCSHIISSSDF